MTTKLYIAAFACLVYLAFVVPGHVSAEKSGVRREGVVVRYDLSFSGRYKYPIVRIERDGQEVELKSWTSWWVRWYDVGEHVPVLDSGGRRAYIGSALARWSDVIGIFVFLGACVAFALWRRNRVLTRSAPLPPLSNEPSGSGAAPSP